MKAIVPAWRSQALTSRWFDEFDQAFDQMLRRNFESDLALACDVDETEKYLMLSFDLPGLDEKDINIEIHGNRMSVSGERKQEVVSEGQRTYRGRRFGKFQQTFNLPKNLDFDGVEADYSQGVLKILLPKREAEKSQAKRVEVKSSKGGFLSQLLGSKQENK
jgi:HSP20 family protein